MSQDPPADPPCTQGGRERDVRLAREAAALRENLRRRKQQTRARTARPDHAPGQADEGTPEPG